MASDPNPSSQSSDGPVRRSLVLDLSGVDFLTAGRLGELVTLHARLRDLGGELVLDNVGERAFEVLEVARLTEVLHVRRADPFAEGFLPPKA
jgi:anti-anti-sigma factor